MTLPPPCSVPAIEPASPSPAAPTPPPSCAFSTPPTPSPATPSASACPPSTSTTPCAPKTPTPTSASSKTSAPANSNFPSTSPVSTPGFTPPPTAKPSKKPPATFATRPSPGSSPKATSPTSLPPIPSTTRPKPFSASSSAAPGSKAFPLSLPHPGQRPHPPPPPPNPPRRPPPLPSATEAALARRRLQPRPAFTRNRLRHAVLPLLREENPSIDTTLANLAELAREEEDRWQTELGKILPGLLLPRQTRPRRRPFQLTAPNEQALAIELERLRPLDPLSAAASCAPPPSSLVAGFPSRKPPACLPSLALPPPARSPTPPFPPSPAVASSSPTVSSPSAVPASSAFPVPLPPNSMGPKFSFHFPESRGIGVESHQVWWQRSGSAPSSRVYVYTVGYAAPRLHFPQLILRGHRLNSSVKQLLLWVTLIGCLVILWPTTSSRLLAPKTKP